MVGGNEYLNCIQNKLSGLLEDLPLEAKKFMIYQHIGAPLRFSRAMRQYLNKIFTSWIGKGGTIPWIFCLGKSQITSLQPGRRFWSRAQAENTAVNKMRRVMTAGVTESQVQARRTCLRQNGRHFEQLLYKMYVYNFFLILK